MEFLYLNNDPRPFDAIFKSVIVERKYGLYRCDFSNLFELGTKINFLHSHSDMNEERQMEHSLIVHNKSEYFSLIEKAINSKDFNEQKGFIRGIQSLLETPQPTYSVFSQWIHDDLPLSLSIGLRSADTLPNYKELVPVYNFFSQTFVHALKQVYGDVNIQFVIIEPYENTKILAMKVEGNGKTGYYNLSYKKPYKGIALI
ncbi:hypothetical protein [Nonlabens sp. Asnod2-A12]|uniref:hypothetical protein n=1 Tax=Nonlabens sp. Asnod2-A12 TaxID=3160578 RepID=UPI003869F1F2